MQWITKGALGLVLIGAVAAIWHDRATAGPEPAQSAFMAGMEVVKKTPVEVVVFNTGALDLQLDLEIRDADGNVLYEAADDVDVEPRQTAAIDVAEKIVAGATAKRKPFAGLVSVRLTGDAPFHEETVILHATQYFGKRTKPKNAIVYEPVWAPEEL